MVLFVREFGARRIPGIGWGHPGILA